MRMRGKVCEPIITLAILLMAVLLLNVVAADERSPDRHRRESQMTQGIDQQIGELLVEEGHVVSPLCTDEEFLRRASLDLTGVIPTVAEVREFLSDSRPDKRSIWIDRLLDSPRHATHLAVTWRRLLLPADFDSIRSEEVAGLQSWLRQQFVENLRYDRLVAQFLSATGDQQTGPALFYRSLEAKPEKLAAVTARIFLGVQIECAQCHDHPFDDWTQQDFWGYAAFFAQLEPDVSMRNDEYRLVDLPTGEVSLPGTGEIISPRFPSGQQPDVHARGTRRRQLAIWMASRDNPFLAPAAINRAWAHLFGRGLVHPLDDLGPHNPPIHPQLFDELAQFFVDVDFDLKSLYRCLVNTQTYQRSSRFDDLSGPVSSYAHMAVKRMTPEQLYDSLHRSLALPGGVPGPDDPQRREFVAQLSSPSRDLTDYDLGIQQALRLMNGTPILQATSLDASGVLAALTAPFFDDNQRIDVLFLATMSRFPSDREREACGEMLGAAEPNSTAYGDMLWAFLNSAEYQFNH